MTADPETIRFVIETDLTLALLKQCPGLFEVNADFEVLPDSEPKNDLAQCRAVLSVVVLAFQALMSAPRVHVEQKLLVKELMDAAIAKAQILIGQKEGRVSRDPDDGRSTT
jgi:hypothetical protein